MLKCPVLFSMPDRCTAAMCKICAILYEQLALAVKKLQLCGAIVHLNDNELAMIGTELITRRKEAIQRLLNK